MKTYLAIALIAIAVFGVRYWVVDQETISVQVNEQGFHRIRTVNDIDKNQSRYTWPGKRYDIK